MTLEGIVQKGVIVPTNGTPLPEGRRVKIIVEEAETAPQTAKDLLMKVAGCMSELPSDLARNHDHYIHGTPKR